VGALAAAIVPAAPAASAGARRCRRRRRRRRRVGSPVGAIEGEPSFGAASGAAGWDSRSDGGAAPAFGVSAVGWSGRSSISCPIDMGGR